MSRPHTRTSSCLLKTSLLVSLKLLPSTLPKSSTLSLLYFFAAISDDLTDLDNTLTFKEKTWKVMPFEQTVTNGVDGYYYSKTI